MVTPARIARFAGRVALAGVVATVVAVVAMQFESIVAKNLALAHELAASRAKIAAIRAATDAERTTIVRLGDPRGAIPEIHEKLRLVGPHEEMIYVRGASPSPQADDWNAAR